MLVLRLSPNIPQRPHEIVYKDILVGRIVARDIWVSLALSLNTAMEIMN